jgi:hypothetical protein
LRYNANTAVTRDQRKRERDERDDADFARRIERGERKCEAADAGCDREAEKQRRDQTRGAVAEQLDQRQAAENDAEQADNDMQ